MSRLKASRACWSMVSRSLIDVDPTRMVLATDSRGCVKTLRRRCCRLEGDQVASVTVEDLAKRFGAVTALKPTSLSIANGEFVVIVGASGCGKSTLLRLIAGLEEPSTGRITFDGRDVTYAAPADRGLGCCQSNTNSSLDDAVRALSAAT